MKITLDLSVQHDRIVVNSPETGFHDEVANLILFDKVEKKIIGVGVSLEEVEQRSPEEYTKRKESLVSMPGYSAEDFQLNMTAFIVYYYSSAASTHKRKSLFANLFGKDKVHLNLTLPKYEQIPHSERDMFEYMLLMRSFSTNPPAKQLTINDREITSVNDQIVREQRIFNLQEKAANLLVVGMNLIFMLLFMGGFGLFLYGIIPTSVWQWLEEMHTINPILMLALVMLIAIFFIVLSAFLGELLGTLFVFSLLKRLWTKNNVEIVIHNHKYSSKRIKQIVEKSVKLT